MALVIDQFLLLFPNVLKLAVQLVFLFDLLFFIFGASLPLFNVQISRGYLHVMNIGTDFSQLVIDWQHHELDETGLPACNIGACPIAHHADLQSLSFFHVSLVEEFFEKQISPLNREVELSKRC